MIKKIILLLLTIIAIISMIAAIFACAFTGISGYTGNHVDLLNATGILCVIFFMSVIGIDRVIR